MCKNNGLSINGVSFEERFVSDYVKLDEKVKAWKKDGLRVVLTSGSYDLLHIGHAQYLMKAKACGDVLVVGVDDDEKVKYRKGNNRPVVPEKERYTMLAHLRHVDIVVPKSKGDPDMHLIMTICPDVLVISETTKHRPERIEKMKKFCSEIKLLPPQATTSTSAKIRKVFTQGVKEFADKLTKKIDELLHEMTE